MTKDVERLVEEHWVYVKKLLQTHGVPDDVMGIVEFHYKSAMRHGIKHGKEETR